MKGFHGCAERQLTDLALDLTFTDIEDFFLVVMDIGSVLLERLDSESGKFLTVVLVDKLQRGFVILGYKFARKSTQKTDAKEPESDDSSMPTKSFEEAKARDGSETAEDVSGNSQQFVSSASIQRSPTSQARSAEASGSEEASDQYVNYNPGPKQEALSARYGIEFDKDGQPAKLQRLENEFGSNRVSRWVDEGMPIEAMAKPQDMEAFRERQKERSEEGPTTDRPLTARSDFQPNLAVSEADDPAEREAEEVAEKVLEMDENREQPAAEESAAADMNRTAATDDGAVTDATESVVRSGLQGEGKPLPAETRSAFEAKMAADFSDVRVHTDAAADRATQSIDAEAYTIGSDIAFSEGSYDPGSKSGQRLLAHELTHVVQQTGVGQPTPVQRQATTTGGESESPQGAAQQHAEPAGLPQDSEPYEIQHGDTLSAIAQRHDVPGGWKALWNYKDNRQVIGDNPNLIYPDDVIQVPTIGEGESTTEETPPTTEEEADAPAEDSAGGGEYQADNELTFNTSGGPIASIYFPTGDSALDRADQQTLTRLDETLYARRTELLFNPNYDAFRLEFVGYADRQQYASGSEVPNQLLSSKRAMSVKSALTEMSGYQRLTQYPGVLPSLHLGWGSVGPAPSEATKAQLAEHRRVDVVLTPEDEGRKPKEDEGEEEPGGHPTPDLPEKLPPGWSIADIISIGIQGIDTIANIAVLFGFSLGWAAATAILGMVAAPFVGRLVIQSAHDINKKAAGVAGYCYGGTEVLINGTISELITDSGEFQGGYFFNGYTDDDGYYNGAQTMQEKMNQVAKETQDEREKAKQAIFNIVKEVDSPDKQKAQIKAELEKLSENGRLYVMSQLFQDLDISDVPAEKVLNKLWDESLNSMQGPGWGMWEGQELEWWDGPGYHGGS